jgi:hypothetical protein
MMDQSRRGLRQATIAVDVSQFDPINPFDCWRL